MNGRRESLPPTTGLRYRLAIRNSPGHIHLNVGRSATCSPAACRSFISFSCSVRNSRQCWYCGSFRGSGSARPFNQKSTQSTAPSWTIQQCRGFCSECVPPKWRSGRRVPPAGEAPSGTRNLRLPHTHIYVCICVSCGQTVGRAPSSRPMQLIRFIFRFGTNRNSTGRLERGVPG